MATQNVFAQLGLENDSATIEAWRSDFARIIRDYFKRSQMTQTQFADRVGVKQSVVSKIIRGRLGAVSIEFLLRLCVKLETRGRAEWGPSPDEAFVTSDMEDFGGTDSATVNIAMPAAVVQLNAQTTHKSRTGLTRTASLGSSRRIH